MAESATSPNPAPDNAVKDDAWSEYTTESENHETGTAINNTTAEPAHPVAVGITQDQCCGGGNRVLPAMRVLYTLNMRFYRGFIFYVLIFIFVSAPIIFLSLGASLGNITVMGAFSIFGIPPISYVHGLWYWRKNYLFNLFNEVMDSGLHYQRKAEKLVRRHLFTMFIIVPVSSAFVSAAFFSSEPLRKIFIGGDVVLYRWMVVPFFIMNIMIMFFPAMFAMTFSLVWKLHGLRGLHFIEVLEVERPPVPEVITRHLRHLNKLHRSAVHWRIGYTLVVLLSLAGVTLTFAVMIFFDGSLLPELIPFTSMLDVFLLVLNAFFFWCIVIVNKRLRGVENALERYMVRLAISQERITLAVHCAAHKGSGAFTIFGFTGFLIIDLLMCGVFFGLIILGENALNVAIQSVQSLDD